MGAINIKPLPLKSGQWFREKTKKRAIVGHGTAGPSVSSAFNDWNNTQVQVATSFIIDEHGVIFQVFPDEEWAYHTGSGEAYDKSTIGVELVWPGFLVRKTPDSTPRAWYGQYDGIVYKHPVKWRGKQEYATYAGPQIEAFALLTDHLIRKHNIPREFVTPAQFLSYDPKFAKTFNGVLPHSILSDVRYDLGPSFPWTSYVEKVQELQ